MSAQIIADGLQNPRAALEAVLASPPDRDMLDLLAEIVRLADAIGPESASQLLVRDPSIRAIRPRLLEEFNEYISAMEVEETKRLLAAEIPAPISFRTFATAGALGMFARLESLASHVTKPGMKRVVMVGCGWRPVTMFYLHEATDAREIIGLDVVPDAVETSAALSRKLGYDRISTTVCEGAEYDYAGADLVYIASMVHGKRDVIARILETAPEDVRLALWEPAVLGSLWLEGSHPETIPGLEITGYGPVLRQSQDIFARRRRTTPQTWD
jgi:hypothetical protein